MTHDPGEEGVLGCSSPFHCPCGCGAHVGCFIYGDDVPTDHLELAYARAMNDRLGLFDMEHSGRSTDG